MKLKKMWVTPQGKVGKSFEAYSEYGVTLKQINEIKSKLNSSNWQPPVIKTNKSDKGLVVVSDLHTGSIAKATIDIVRTQEFNYDILLNYLNDIVVEVNSRNFSEVSLMIPGDIVETFTALNHKDTWKSIDMYQGDVVIIVHKLLKDFLSQIHNLKSVYMVEGNHDRLTPGKWTNSRKGIVQIVAHFLNQTSNVNVHYHPFIKSVQYDGIYYIMTHGDLKPWKGKANNHEKFIWKYGKQGLFNVMLTGHYHNFSIINSDIDFMHISCPSLFTGNFFSESIGYNNLPGYLIITNKNNKPKVEYIPC